MLLGIIFIKRINAYLFTKKYFFNRHLEKMEKYLEPCVCQLLKDSMQLFCSQEEEVVISRLCQIYRPFLHQEVTPIWRLVLTAMCS